VFLTETRVVADYVHAGNENALQRKEIEEEMISAFVISRGLEAS